MPTFVAFLRGINVGGNTMLPMKELAALCVDIGFQEVRTHINSGNVIFKSALSEEKLKTNLTKALHEKTGRSIDVMIRNDLELRSILAGNPFPDANGSQVGVVLLTKPVPKNLLDDMVISGPEEVRLAHREIYIHYPNGMGRSKLKFPSTGEAGTIRNINTIAKLVELTKSDC